MFRIEMLPAREGDCLWMSYGDPATPRHVLVDGGRKATAKTLRQRLEALGPAGRIELLVISHIDRDHIEGILTLLEAGGLGVEVGDVWFNGYDHLLGPDVQPFGAAQGERLSKALLDLNLPWNATFGGGRICITNGKLPKVKLPGGLEITVLSPTPAKLAALRPVWEVECQKAGLSLNHHPKPQGEKPPGIEIMGAIDVDGLAASPFSEDSAEPNGSSIAMLVEFEGKRALLGADAHPAVLVDALKVVGNGAPVALDAFKIAHHGSAHNTSDALIQAVVCDRWLVSSNGSYFQHPDRSAVARVIKQADGKRQIFFNYRSKFSEIWDDPAVQAKFKYSTVYPLTAGAGHMALDL
jgi:hypothetical protein